MSAATAGPRVARSSPVPRAGSALPIARALAGRRLAGGHELPLRRDRAEALAGEIAAAGGTAVPLGGDIRDRRGARGGSFAAMEAEHGPVLVLVNNAGIRDDDLAPQIDDDAWARVVDTNLSAAFRATRRGAASDAPRALRRIVNVASVVGPRANAGQANYAAAKAGLIGMTRTVAVEVARRGITVNAVAPGLVETRFTEDVNGDALGEIPARRAGTPDEVAACVRFLVSEEASYVTGTTLTVDGGLSA